MQAIYAVHPVSSRHVESRFLEGSLDKWYIDLPEHLRYEPGSSRHPSPSPHVLTLHMQYWCAVLLLHRPLYVFCFCQRPRSIHLIWDLVSDRCALPRLSSRSRLLVFLIVIDVHDRSPDDSDGEVRALAEKSYELCAGAANHITSIGMFCFTPFREILN